MRILLLLLFLISIVVGDEVSLKWPNAKFEHVVAYCYDYSRDPRGASITFDDGSLNEGVIRATTVRLSKNQSDKLLQIVAGNTDNERGGVLCYLPHHAFVFYDSDWKVVASIDVCFMCNDYRMRPGKVIEGIDLTKLEAFCQEVGLPRFKEAQDYSDLYWEEQPKKEAKVDSDID